MKIYPRIPYVHTWVDAHECMTHEWTQMIISIIYTAQQTIMLL